MKIFFYILGLALLYVLVMRFLKKREVHIEVNMSKMFSNKTIPYLVTYNGITFNGVYDLTGGSQTDERSGYTVKAFREGMVFGLRLSEGEKVIKDLKIDLLTQKLILNV